MHNDKTVFSASNIVQPERRLPVRPFPFPDEYPGARHREIKEEQADFDNHLNKQHRQPDTGADELDRKEGDGGRKKGQKAITDDRRPKRSRLILIDKTPEHHEIKNRRTDASDNQRRQRRPPENQNQAEDGVIQENRRKRSRRVADEAVQVIPDQRDQAEFLRAVPELWHQALAAVWPEDADTLALHHGSLDPALRQQVEDGLRAGALRCVVATSSLDLGVDFPEVEQVLQLGSPKGVARLRQRAGRARHRPGAKGAIVCIPSHALELAEYAAVRRALHEGVVEARRPPTLSLDVLAQHAVSRALAGGFDSDALLAQVRRTHAFATLGDEQWRAVLDFIVQGGQALAQYPDFHKVVRDADGSYRMHDRRQALRHRLSIGTISSDGSVRVQFLRGGGLGAVEEQFASRLRRGDRFQFAGRLLELVQLRDMTAFVRLARGRGDGVVPRWQGGQLPLSMPLGRELEWVLSGADDSAESRWLSPLLALQQQLSALPGPEHLLVEEVRRREGQFMFVYPFAGRHVHEALAALLALRCTRQQRNSIGYAVNDHGLVLAPARPIDLDEAQWRALFGNDRLLADLREAVNLGELARRQFRGIARVAGLLVPSLPGGMPRSLRQLQASAGLLYDVLREHDPEHLLLALAEHEVLYDSLDLPGVQQVLERIGTQQLSLQRPSSLTPLGFPLWAERLRGQFSNEDWRMRVQRAAQQLERRHDQ